MTSMTDMTPDLCTDKKTYLKENEDVKSTIGSVSRLWAKGKYFCVNISMQVMTTSSE